MTVISFLQTAKVVSPWSAGHGRTRAKPTPFDLDIPLCRAYSTHGPDQGRWPVYGAVVVDLWSTPSDFGLHVGNSGSAPALIKRPCKGNILTIIYGLHPC